MHESVIVGFEECLSCFPMGRTEWKTKKAIHTKFETNQPNLMTIPKLRFYCFMLLGLDHGDDGYGLLPVIFPFTLI